MKSAVILFHGTPLLSRRAGEVNSFLDRVSPQPADTELWLFYHGRRPDKHPEINAALSAVVRIPIDHCFLPESYLAALEQLAAQRPVDLMVFSSDSLGAQLATRLAFRLSGSSGLNIETVSVRADHIDVSRPCYANQLTAHFKMTVTPYCLSVAKQACRPARILKTDAALMLDPAGLVSQKTAWVRALNYIPDPHGSKLSDANRIIAVGRGVKSKADLDRLKQIAKTLNACLGASRPLVMNGWASMAELLGASGTIASPKLCIAAGVSGTGYFSIGIRASEIIVAINSDPNAPIFKIAHVGIVDDAMAALNALEKIVSAYKNDSLSEAKNG